MRTEGTKVCDGKKIINGKSYNVNYDSEKITSYKVVIDGWARTSYDVYKKKSTGEYFSYNRWSPWNQDWDIDLMDQDQVDKIMKWRKMGYDHKFVAHMADFPGEKGTKGQYYWGTADEDPWMEDWKKKRERKEMLKKARAEQKKKLEQYEQNLKEGKVEDGGEGVAEVYRVSDCFSYNGQWWNNVYVRVVNKDGKKGWYRTGLSIASLEKVEKKEVRKVMTDILLDVEKEMGRWDSVNKGGFIYWSDHNKEMFDKMKEMVKERNSSLVSK